MNIENKKNRCIGYSLVAVTLMHPLQPLMAAAIIAKDNNTQIHNINDIPIIDIAKPNQSGISHNQFIDFNVSEKGVVLNNSTIAGQSQLAGKINGNANLNSSNAKLIINEVFGNGRSELKGQTEVFGNKADILIANPNGITCDGCGFINTNGLTLTTGSPSFDKNGALQTLTTTKGTIVIGSQGMDTTNLDYTDIISRATEINGQIKAQNLNFIQGANKIDYATGQVTSVPGVGIKPSISLDTKALGGMYANKIHLVSTENGVGVNLNSLVTTKNNIILAADGKIQLGDIQSKTDLDIKAKSLEITSNKNITSGSNMTITADAVTNDKGQIVSGRDMRIYANNIINTQGTIEANNNLWIQKDINDNRSESLQNISGTIKTNTGDLVIRSESVKNLRETFTTNTVEIKPDARKFAPLVIIKNYYGQQYYYLTPTLVSFTDKFFEEIAPELKDKPDNVKRNYAMQYMRNYKWLGEADFKLGNHINISKNIHSILNIAPESQIDSGKNLYINADKLENNLSKISSIGDMILTGGSFLNNSQYIGTESEFHKFVQHKHATWNFLTRDSFIRVLNSYSPNIGFQAQYFFDGQEIKLDVTSELSSPIYSGGNLIADFKDDIKLSKQDNEKYQHIVNVADRPTTLSAHNNIVLNANNIDIGGIVRAKGDISLLATNNITVENSELSTDKDINAVTVNDIHLSQSKLIANNMSLISRTGSIKAITADNTHFLDASNEQIFGKLESKNKLDIEAGKDILLADLAISADQDVSITAGHNFKLENTNILLEKSNYPGSITSQIQQNYFDHIFNKTNKINIGGNITIQSGQTLDIDGITLTANKNIDFTAGGDVILTPRLLEDNLEKKYFLSENESQLSGVINSAGNIFINAGRDIYSKAATINSKGNIHLIAGRDILLPAVAYTIDKNSSIDNQHIVTHINADKKLSFAVNGELIANGAEFTSGDDMLITSRGKMEFNSVVNSNDTQLGNSRSSKTTQQSVILSSGGNLSLISNSSILFQATDLDANKSINAAAKGGFLFAQAMQESSYYQTTTTKRKWHGGKKTVTTTSNSIVNKVVDFTANENITLISAGDSTYQASQIKAGQDINLTSTNGKVIFEGVKDSEFSQTITKSTGFYIKHSDKGYEQDKWKLPIVQAGGQFTVDSVKGISADIITQKNQSLQNALTLLSNTDGTQWLKDLDKQGDVEWNKVQDAHNSWNYETQSLNPVVAAVIAVAVAIATSGTGLAAMAGEGVAAGTTVGTTSHAILYSMGSQAMTALTSKAAVSLVENKGNISKTLHSLGSNESVKSIASSMIVGGVMAGFDDYLAINSQALQNGEKLTLVSNSDWNTVAQSVVGHSVIDAGVNSAINGGSFKDRFAGALLANVGNQVNAESANLIGKYGNIIGRPGKFISHSLTSALAAEIGGGSGKGAAAGALAAELAVIALDDSFKSQRYSSEELMNISKIAGAIAGGIATHSPQGVYSGANAAHIVVENNYLSSSEDRDKKDAQAQLDLIEKGLMTVSEEKIQELQNKITAKEFLDQYRDEILSSACQNLSASACSDARADLKAAYNSYFKKLSPEEYKSYSDAYLANYAKYYDGYKKILSQLDALDGADLAAYNEYKAQNLSEGMGISIETARNIIKFDNAMHSASMIASMTVGPKVIEPKPGLVWNAIRPTQPNYPGLNLPKSFEITLTNGRKVWVHGNATKHIAEYSNSKAINGTSEFVNLITQQQLNSFESAVNNATKNNIRYNERITVDGWQLEFKPPRAAGELPTITHARYIGAN